MIKKLGKAALGILKGVAPMAATAIGGPFGPAAAAIIAKTVGVEEKDLDEFIVSSKPENLLALKNAEAEFEKFRIEAGIREDQLEYEDRASARRMVVDTGIWIQASLTFVFIAGYFAMIYFLVSYVLDDLGPTTLGILTTLIGVITGEVPRIMAFWFGSSRGSKEKTQALQAAATRDTARDPDT